MKKLLIFLIALLLPLSAFAANVWEEGAGNDVISGSDSPSDIDTLLDAASTEPLTRLLQEYREGAELEYSSVSELTVADGQVTVQNSAGTVVAFLSNSSSTDVTFSDLDTGSEAASTTYYIYAYCSDPTNDLDFDIAISTNSSTPTGISYYRRLGSFYNDSDSDIDYDSVRNDGFYTTKMGSWESKSFDTAYEASTDGIALGYIDDTGGGDCELKGYTDGDASPTTVRSWLEFRGVDDGYGTITLPVKKGDYWKIEVGEVGAANTLYWIPLEIE